MDMEFAMSLQNLESGPQAVPTITSTSSGTTPTTDDESDNRTHQNRTRLYGLEGMNTASFFLILKQKLKKYHKRNRFYHYYSCITIFLQSHQLDFNNLRGLKGINPFFFLI